MDIHGAYTIEVEPKCQDLVQKIPALKNREFGIRARR
jgi:hypothetical protein